MARNDIVNKDGSLNIERIGKYHDDINDVNAQLAERPTQTEVTNSLGLKVSFTDLETSKNITTNTGMLSASTSGVTPSQAYENGFVAPADIEITKIKLNPNITSTQFVLFAFDKTLKLLQTVSVTPTITNKEFTLPSPLAIPKDGKLFMRFLDGTFYYKNTGVSTFKEYRPGSSSMVDSPVIAGYEINYTIKKGTYYDNSTLELSDYIMPKYKEILEAVGYVGRWWDKVVDTVTYKATNNQGSQIFFKVSGVTSVTVGIQPITAPNNPYYYAYSIDGEPFVRKAITDGVITLPDTKEHIVQVIIDGMGENDPIAGGKWDGTVGVYFTGVTVGTGGTIKGVLPINRKGVFIGDSITEGINVLTTGANGASNSASNAYPMVCAKRLNAVPYYIGYGGTGVLANASFHKAIEAIDYFYNGVPSDTPDVDFIVMAHGYNDNTLINNGTYTADQFKTAYNEVLDRLKIKFSGVPIICVVPFGAQAIQPLMEECITWRNYCYLVKSDTWIIAKTDSAHPNMYGSKVLGTNIAIEIERILGKPFFMK